MSAVLLVTDAERAAFVEAAARHVGVALPQSYLARGRVVGLYDGAALVGGFVFVERGPFRSVEQLPDAHRARVEARLTRCPRLVEANGTFLLPQARLRGAELFHALARELRATGASHVLFSYAASAEGLVRMYGQLSPELLYLGPVRALEGMSGPEVERVELADAVRSLAALTARAQRRELERAA